MPRKKVSSPKTGDTDTDKYQELLKQLKADIVGDLKKQLEKKLESIKLDLTADFKEQISRVKAPAPTVATPTQAQSAPPMNLQSIMGMLSNPNADLSQLASMIPQAPPPSPEALSKMSPEQIDLMKSQQNNQMLMGILPAILQSSNTGQSQIVGELMNRMFFENILQSTQLQKAMTGAVLKHFGVDSEPVNTTLMTPATNQVKAMAAKQVQDYTQQNQNMQGGAPIG